MTNDASRDDDGHSDSDGDKKQKADKRTEGINRSRTRRIGGSFVISMSMLGDVHRFSGSNQHAASAAGPDLRMRR